jgi:topoisomerase-4 subunit A
VSDVLRRSVDRTKDLLQKELEIDKSEKEEALLFASLEKSSSKNVSIRQGI